MARFILIHGAWHGAWCWDRIGPILRAAGHEVVAPDLPGMGSDSVPLEPDVLSQWAEFVADLVRRRDDAPIVLGHSRGGIVISEAAERVPDAIGCLVYLAAFLLPAGLTIREQLSSGGQSKLFGALRRSEDHAWTTVHPNAATGLFYNLTDEVDARWAISRLTPEPVAAVTRPLRITDVNFGRVPRIYIEAEYDQAIPLPIQREMHARLSCQRVISLPSDHSPFLSKPDLLARVLLDLPRRTVRASGA